MSIIVSIETLLYIIKGNKILLIEKKRGLGAGLYNGVGGKVNPGETPIQAAIRETIEEIGVKPRRIEWMGLLEFYNDGKLYGYVHVFRAFDYEGSLIETDEAKPIWFEIDSIPYNKMWEDDKYWLPQLLRGRKFYGKFYFENNWEKLVKSELYLLQQVLWETADV